MYIYIYIHTQGCLSAASTVSLAATSTVISPLIRSTYNNDNNKDRECIAYRITIIMKKCMLTSGLL